MDFENQVIMCIVNAGFAEAVMDVAKEYGAKGGTIIHARGTASDEAQEFFNIAVSSDKEIVMMVVPTKIKDDILHGLYKNIGLDSAGQGIAFALPVDSVVGIQENK